MSQSETVMLIVLGIAIGVFISMLAGRIAWKLALRVGARRARRTIPSSIAELQNDRDKLRTEQAVLASQTEARLEEMRMRLAEQSAEVSRSRNRIELLQRRLDERDRQIMEMERGAASVQRQAVTPQPLPVFTPLPVEPAPPLTVPATALHAKLPSQNISGEEDTALRQASARLTQRIREITQVTEEIARTKAAPEEAETVSAPAKADAASVPVADVQPAAVESKPKAKATRKKNSPQIEPQPQLEAETQSPTVAPPDHANEDEDQQLVLLPPEPEDLTKKADSPAPLQIDRQIQVEHQAKEESNSRRDPRPTALQQASTSLKPRSIPLHKPAEPAIQSEKQGEARTEGVATVISLAHRIRALQQDISR